ncbi:protein of unknown function DUF187 [Thalassoporum mexicanum PCC 7367]|nr:protein of unknown function DUF187 [Pseudanabaena sp. PCC 7367]
MAFILSVLFSSGLGLVFSLGISTAFWTAPVQSQSPSNYCRNDRSAIVEKAQLLQAALKGDNGAQDKYQRMIKADATNLSACRQRNWPKTQAVWLRVYPCDLAAGQLEQILDNIVNFGYNRVYLNTFYDGRVLLPKNDNPTVWPSVVGDRAASADLLAETIQKAHQRGLTVHAWLFTMNFGPSYAGRVDRQLELARNGYGESNIQDPAGLPGEAGVSHVFVDPYSLQARADLRNLVAAVAKRRPDGIAFDYVRYPHRTDGKIADVRNMMIYGSSSVKTLLSRANTKQGQDIIYQYLQDGRISGQVKQVSSLWDLWRFPPNSSSSAGDVNGQLWQLAIAHARHGVVEFLNDVIQPAKQMNISTSAVFFPKANLSYGNAVDARLQPWDRFTSVSEWVPMSYSTCGNASCINNEIAMVTRRSGGRKVCPVIAGYWSQDQGKRISLEKQMAGIRRQHPDIDCLSHFAYSWFDMAGDRQRRACKL